VASITGVAPRKANKQLGSMCGSVGFVIVGESGSGKTSLLRAGLSDVLEKAKVGHAYWEAVPTAPVQGLLRAIGSASNIARADRPRSLDEVVTGSHKCSRLVIATDQFEQLQTENAEHRVIFDYLRTLITQAQPPHNVTWIVAFRRDYEPDWRDFEEPLGRFHPRLSLRLFTEAHASGVMATIAAEAGFALNSALLSNLNPGGCSRWANFARGHRH
jgi:hypothetical protein